MIKNLFSVVFILIASTSSAIVASSNEQQFGYSEINLSQHTPIPEKKEGFNIGAKNTKSKLDVFLDPFCIDSKEFFGFLLQLLKTTVNGKPVGEQIGVYLHPIALPYHRFSFYATAFFSLFQNEPKLNPFMVDFLHLTFNKMDDFNGRFADLSVIQVKQKFIEVTKAILPNDIKSIIDGIFTKTDSMNLARLKFKYAAFKQVTGAPFLFINDVLVENVPETFESLQQLVQQYI